MSPCQCFLEALRSKGYRITHQRELVIEAIAHSGNHVNAEEVFTRIRGKYHSVNITTVYRTLELLVEQGLASRIELGAGRVIYATYQHGSHIHLVCRQCGQVLDANQDLLLALTDQLNAGYHFAADLQHISVLGLCRTCQAKQLFAREV
ncbi:MAG TPA: Fur family transcriptional regulator [Anaerolineales bacterium]